MTTQQHQLEAEIEFWREMIQRQDRTQDSPALERMRQALALAERKLRLLEPACVDAPVVAGHPRFPFHSARYKQ